MQQLTPLDYQRPSRQPTRWFGFAAAALITHWLLLFGWGLAGNDTAKGYIYCRLAMPDNLDLISREWLFTLAALALLIVCGLIDHAYLNVSRRGGIYPSVLFIFTQLVAVWISMSSRW